MASFEFLKYLLQDDRTLDDYVQGSKPEFEDICRRLFLMKRKENFQLPDHFLFLGEKDELSSYKSLADLLVYGLRRIANFHLRLVDNHIIIQQNRMESWQETLTYMPPSVLIAALISNFKICNRFSRTELLKFYNRYVYPNTKYTDLPSSSIPCLNTIIDRGIGLYDLHLHLNGSTETDRIWLDFLSNPYRAYKTFEQAFRNPLTKELYEQNSSYLTPYRYYLLLKTARTLREHLFNLLYPMKEPEYNYAGTYHHPCVLLFHDDINRSIKDTLGLEVFFYVLLFHYLEDTRNIAGAKLIHYYFLILGFTHHMLVQQKDQNGFGQFQKITVHDLREYSEHQDYRGRFLQLGGNLANHYVFIEGRFSPKPSVLKNMDIINRIYSGWNKQQSYRKCGNKANLSLLVHFIKSEDKENNRHRKLRFDIWNKTKILSYMKKNKFPHIELIKGFDAAASEFDTPPEVFASAYRRLRRYGFKHFTYHAGEDFYHIISGLRAIYEAIIFLDLKAGDRIGHAVATGLDPNLWINTIGRTFVIRQGEYLDDLIFVYDLITEYDRNGFIKTNTLIDRLPLLAEKIYSLGSSIYSNSKYYSVQDYIDAWKLRKYCPIHFESIYMAQQIKRYYMNNKHRNLDTVIDNLYLLPIYDSYEERIIKECQNSIKSIELNLLYNLPEVIKQYNKPISISADEFFSTDQLVCLQKMVLEFMHKQGIVIETLPTSNICIGYHKCLKTYHLKNWLEWKKEGYYIPSIVVGTDDAGIFMTNIYNEYACIDEFLTTYCNYSHTDAGNILEELNKNAQYYKFE